MEHPHIVLPPYSVLPTLGSSFKSSEGPEWPVSQLRVTDQTGTLAEEVSHPNLNLGLRLFASRPAPSLARLEMLIEVCRPRPQPLEHSDQFPPLLGLLSGFLWDC